MTTSTLLPILPVTDFTIPSGTLSAGTYTVTVRYNGGEYYAPSSTHLTVKLTR